MTDAPNPNTNPTNPTPPASTTTANGFTLEQSARMATALLKSGADPAAVAAAATKDGMVYRPDNRTPEEREFDNSVLAPSASTAEFEIDWHGRMPDGMSADELPAFNTNMRAALSAMGMPSAIGGGVAEMGLDDARAYSQLDEPSRAMWQQEQRALLGKVVGADNVDRAVSNARVLLSMVKDANPAAHAQLTNAKVFAFSARTIAMLHLQAERLLARNDRRPK